MTFEAADEPTELIVLGMFRLGLDHLIKAVDAGRLEQLGGMGVVEFMQELERPGTGCRCRSSGDRGR